MSSQNSDKNDGRNRMIEGLPKHVEISVSSIYGEL